LISPVKGTIDRNSGCGSASVAQLPAPAGSGGRAEAGPGLVAVVLPRARELELRSTATGHVVSRAAAGVGPTDVACLERWCYVLDRQGHGILVFSIRPLELVRRQYVRVRPLSLELDRVRRLLLVTLPDRHAVAEYSAGARPHLLRERPWRPVAAVAGGHDLDHGCDGTRGPRAFHYEARNVTRDVVTGRRRPSTVGG
jgi:hypothetical protein